MNWRQWWLKQPPYSMIGMAGVSRDESHAARKWSSILAYIKIFLAMWLLYQWQMEIHHHYHPAEMYFANVLVWLFFILDLGIELVFVQKRAYYLMHNWFKPLVILIGVPYLFNWWPIIQHLNELRPALALVLLVPAIRIIRVFLSDGKLLTTLMATAIVIVVVGLLVAGVDPNIHSGLDGIWWAVATVSTVGYGDVVPTSVLGKIIGIILILVGLGLFVVLTANLLAILLKKGQASPAVFQAEAADILQTLKKLQQEQELLNSSIAEIKAALSNKNSKRGDSEK